MLPRTAGGVVDPELLVYGTENIRIVDLSIIPLEVASHLQCECAFRLLMQILTLIIVVQLLRMQSDKLQRILSRARSQIEPEAEETELIFAVL